MTTIRQMFIVLVALTAASCAATVSVKAGFFFGHDLRQSEHIVYVLDLSGSMNAKSGTVVENVGTDLGAKAAGGLLGGFAGRSAGNAAQRRIEKMKKKIEKVKLHLIASLNGLQSTSRYNIIMFDGSVSKLSPVPLPATGISTVAVSVFVDKLEAGGSTNIYEAMEAALSDGPTHVILLTDGMPTSSSPQQIINLVRGFRQNSAFVVSTVGVGTDQARGFLSQLAEENGGSYQFYN